MNARRFVIKDRDQQESSTTLVDRIRCQNGKEKLDLSLCNIVDVPVQDIRDNFQGQLPLHLDLSKNFICYIGSQFIRSVSHLTQLNLSSNNIKRLPDNFGVLRELTHLYLHKNRLQTLPVSMCRMTNLRYLSLVDNPLRPPLSDFLGYHSRGTGGITETAMAELVVQFMVDFVNAHTPEDSRSQGNSSTVSRRTSSVHYRGQAMRMRCDGDTSASSATSEDTLTLLDETNNNNIIYPPQMTPNGDLPQKDKPTWLKTLIIIGLVIVGIPFLLAYFVDSSYFDYLTEGYPAMEHIWEEFYKPLHETAARVTDWIPKSDHFVLKGPSPDENMTVWSSWFNRSK